MNMTSIMIKFRPSTVDGKEGGLYFQIIHNRVVRQLNTDYKVFAEEWDAEAESVIVNGNRSNLLLGIQERLAWDVARLEKVVRSLETERRRFTADDVITMFHKLTKESSLFTFMHGVIAQLKQLGKVRTSETYTATLNSFMTFRDEQDVPLDCRLYVMMLQFLQEELFIFHIVHKITDNFCRKNSSSFILCTKLLKISRSCKYLSEINASL